MERIDTPLEGVYLFRPKVFTDHRGFFLESYSRRVLAELGVDHDFVQDNHSRSVRGVLRGLHYQIFQTQAKLVRTTCGRVFDVAVDIRCGSPTFGRWVGEELSAENHLMLYAPPGFAHGFVVLSEVAEFQYKCSDYYAPEAERGIAWNDPALAIDWPLDGIEPILSAKDGDAPSLGAVAESDLPRYRQ